MDEPTSTGNLDEPPQPLADATLRGHAELIEEYLRMTPESPFTCFAWSQRLTR